MTLANLTASVRLSAWERIVARFNSKPIQPYCALCHNPIFHNVDSHIPLWWCKVKHPALY